MNKRQLNSLSASLSKAISPAVRRIDATARILDQVEPLAVVSRPTSAESLRDDDVQNSASEQSTSSGAGSKEQAVENALANLATVAKQDASPAPLAAVAKTATEVNSPSHAKKTTVADLATVDTVTEVKGELRISNTIIDSLLPTLEPAAALVYLRLYRLSHGYRKNNCIVGLRKLATATNTSPRTVQRAIEYLEARKLVSRQGASFGGSTKGIQFLVHVPAGRANLTTADTVATVAKMTTVDNSPTMARLTTVVNLATNKDDDLLNTNHHQSENPPDFTQALDVGPQQRRDARRENGSRRGSDETLLAKDGITRANASFTHLTQTITAYTTTTKNPWLQSDTVCYLQHHLDEIPIEKLKAVIRTVFERASSRINSFTYFVKEIVATTDTQTLAAKRKALAGVVKQVRDIHRGRQDYSIADLAFDVKTACSREGVIFDNDLFNELI